MPISNSIIRYNERGHIYSIGICLHEDSFYGKHDFLGRMVQTERDPLRSENPQSIREGWSGWGWGWGRLLVQRSGQPQPSTMALKICLSPCSLMLTSTRSKCLNGSPNIPGYIFNSFKDTFQVHRKIEQLVQRFPVYPLPPHMHSLSHYQHPSPEWYIYYE